MNCLGIWLIRFVSGASGLRGFAAIYSHAVVWSLGCPSGFRANLLLIGSVQSVVGIPDDIKAVYRTAFEIDPRALIDMAVSRSPYVDQSQSFSLFVAQPTPPLLVRRRFSSTLTRSIEHAPDGSPTPRVACGAQDWRLLRAEQAVV